MVARDDGAVTGLNLPECLSALPRSRDVIKVTGNFCLELFCGLASLTLSLVFDAVPCMCPWDSSFGSEVDVLLHGKVLFALAVAGRLAYALFGLPCSPPLRSWDHVWGLPALEGKAAEKVLMGNRLLVFSVQLCFVLHAERHYFSIENPLGFWTWAVAAVARLHAMPGVATVQVYYDQFGTRYSKPTLFLHNLSLLQKLSVPPRATPDEAIVLRGQCGYKGEWRFKTSLASPYPPFMTKLMARVINESFSVKNSASRREGVPLAPVSHDDERPFPAVGPMAPPEGHACYIEGVDLLAGNMFIPDHVRSVARAHFTGADDNDDSEGDDLVPYVHTSAMVPPYGPAGTSRAFPQRIAGTLVGQEHAPTETSRPLSTGSHPCGRLQSFGAARPLLRLSLALGPTVLGHTHTPRLQSEGPIGTRFAMAFMYSLSSANNSELSSS